MRRTPGRTLLLALPLALAGCISEPADEAARIRVHNMSDVGLEAVTIGFPEGSVDFGPVPPGQTSEYRALDRIYRYGSVAARFENGEEFTLQPIDWVGEEPLEGGDYTYHLDLDDDGFRAELGRRSSLRP